MTDTMRLVPAEADEDMRLAGRCAMDGCLETDCRDAAHIWRPMIAASPGAGRVSREKLREALNAAHDAHERQSRCLGATTPLQAAEDALAAALGLEIAED